MNQQKKLKFHIFLATIVVTMVFGFLGDVQEAKGFALNEACVCRLSDKDYRKTRWFLVGWACTQACQEAYGENAREASWSEKTANWGEIKPYNSLECWVLQDPINCPLAHILRVELWVLGIAQTIFGWMAAAPTMSTLLDLAIIYEVWAFVRDFLSLAFILVLLFIVFCSIFQIEKFGYKKALLTLVLMALLVNFSYPITRFIVDASNVMMYTFMRNESFGFKSETATIQLADKSYLQNIVVPEGKKVGDIDTSKMIMGVVVVFVFVVTLLAVGILLLIRSVVLAILIMFSPVAFVGAIIPSAGGVKKYWTMLFQYAFFGPLIIFMMAIALKFMEPKNSILDGIVKFSEQVTNDPRYIANIAVIAIPVVIIWIGLGFAQSMSIAGAGAIVGGARGVMGWAAATFTGWRLAKWGARKAEQGAKASVKYGAKAGGKWLERNVLGPNYSPRAWIAAWKKKAKDTDEAFMGDATGRNRDRLNKLFNRHDITHYKDIEFEARVEKEKKEFVGKDHQLYDETIEAAKQMKTPQARHRAVAAFRGLFEANDQNEYMKAHGRDNDPDELRDFIVDQLHDTGMTDDQIDRELYELGEIALQHGNYANYGMARYNSKTGKYERNNHAQQVEAALAKSQNIDAQQKYKVLHWNSLYVEKKDGKTGPMHEFGQKFIQRSTASEVNQLNRSRGDLINRVYDDINGVDKHLTSVAYGLPNGSREQEVMAKFMQAVEDQHDKVK